MPRIKKIIASQDKDAKVKKPVEKKVKPKAVEKAAVDVPAAEKHSAVEKLAKKPSAVQKGKEKKAVTAKKVLVKPKEKLPEEKVVAAPAAVVVPPVKTAVPPAAPVIEKPAAKPVEKKPEAPKPVIQPVRPAAPAAQVAPAVPVPGVKELELELPITVKDLAIKLQEKPSVIIKKLMDARIMVGINHALDEATAKVICDQYKCTIKKALDAEETALRVHQTADKPEDVRPRPPIVTFMGHVDHGKTSLLDAIRKTKVVEKEHGGITQHIGAYRVNLSHGDITFLDTPGHEAFTAMRARGARVTDIVVLVVAADDGIMPQTVEAIDHARAAGVPIVVAMNKIDKPGANLDQVKKQLSKHDLAAEDWGGKTITVGVSAKTGEGIDDLLEMLLLEAQMLELKCNPKRPAQGVVIEAKMTKGKGPTATLLVENGTLHLNETIIVGNFFGKIRAMFNDRGASVTSAGPAVPVEVLGIDGIPEAGEQFYAIQDEKQAKAIAAVRVEKERQQQMKTIKRISLEDLHAQIAAGKIKELKLILKADVQGSLEAITETLGKLNVSEIKLAFIHTGVGNINSSDVILAVASDALILGFNVVADDRAKELISKEGVDAKIYNIIYELANEIRAAIEGMLEPHTKKIFLGRADVRKVFKLTKAANVAGCYITKGTFNRNAVVSVVRNGASVYEGKLTSLKRFKDDVRDVGEGFECGMVIAGFELVAGDVIEAYQIQQIARKLE